MNRLIWLLLIITAITAAAAADKPARAYTVDLVAYRALTNISGETSCTRDSAKGVWNKGRLMFNDIKLEVDGSHLKWTLPDGMSVEKLKDNPLIQLISQPSISDFAGETTQLIIGECNPKLQYFEPRSDGLYALMTLEVESLGIKYNGVVNDEDPSGLLKLTFSFENTWVEEREKVAGVQLEVGKPKLAHQKESGYLTTLSGEWNVYQSTVPHRGALFLFIRVTEASAGSPSAEQKPVSESASLVSSPEPKAQKASSDPTPSVTVGGSMRVRAEMRK